MFTTAAHVDLHAFSWVIKRVLKRPFFTKKKFSKNLPFRDASFGIALDVDGVFTRGPLVLPDALRASELLHEGSENWRVPVLFLTNAANVSKETKAAELSGIFKRKVNTLR